MKELMYKKSVYLATITISLTGISLSTSVFADTTDATDEIGIEIPVSCTMSGTGTDTHYASIPNGIYSGSYTDPSTNTNYANGIGTTTIKAFCNDNQGFSVYAIGYTDNEEGKNVLTNSTLGSTYDIITGTATGPVGGNDVSNWSMKLSTITSPAPTYPIAIQNSFDNYHAVPDDYTLVAKRESATDVGQNAVGSTLTTTYAAYISKTQPAGLYEGQVKYTMVHPYDTAKPEKKYMQNVSTWGGGIPSGQTVKVVDNRDGQVYTVARLADGKLWMTKNLRLDLSRATITAENTNNPTQAFITAASTTTSSDEWCTSTDSACTDQIKYNTSNINNQTTDSDGHKYDEYGVYYNYYTATAGNGGSNAYSGIVSGDICPSGWHLPSGTSTSSGTSTTWTGEYWKLIAEAGGGIASDGSNFNDLIGPNGTARLKALPYNFPESGYYYNTSPTSLGEYAYYWTPLKKSTTNVYYLSMGSTGVQPFGTIPLFLGSTIRCMADVDYLVTVDQAFAESGKVKYKGHYLMQDMDSSICSSITKWQEGELIDIRDGNLYSIAKMPDNKCWMTKNLRLEPKTAKITIDNTNNPTPSFILDAKSSSSNSETWCYYDSDACVEKVMYYSEFLNNNSIAYDNHTYDEFGVYYNWYTATAGNGIRDMLSGEEVEGDICPKGWHLPIGNPYDSSYSSDYRDLSVSLIDYKPAGSEYYGDPEGIYASNVFRQPPLNFLYSGYFANGVQQVGTQGEYWSSTSYAATRNYSLEFGDNYLRPGSGWYLVKSYGAPVRCTSNN